MEEEWKVVECAPDYLISNMGRIKSCRVYKEGILIKPKADKDGYLEIQLTIDPHHTIWRRVHRLVAEAFLENPYNDPIINHIDGDPANNCVANLEWCDNSHNQLHRYRVMKRGWDGTRKGRAYTFTKVRATNTLTGEVHDFDCINDCARYFDVDDCCIHNRLRGRARNPSESPKSKINGIYFEALQ